MAAELCVVNKLFYAPRIDADDTDQKEKLHLSVSSALIRGQLDGDNKKA
jgi:hypothetical protein